MISAIYQWQPCNNESESLCFLHQKLKGLILIVAGVGLNVSMGKSAIMMHQPVGNLVQVYFLMGICVWFCTYEEVAPVYKIQIKSCWVHPSHVSFLTENICFHNSPSSIMTSLLTSSGYPHESILSFQRLFSEKKTDTSTVRAFFGSLIGGDTHAALEAPRGIIWTLSRAQTFRFLLI